MFSNGRNIAAELVQVNYAFDNISATAGGSGDATAVNGRSLDVTTLAAGKAESVAFLIAVKATLAATKTLTVAAKIQKSSDGTNWTDVATATVLTLTGATGGSTEYGTGKIGVSLEYCAQYVRVVVTPDLSNTATDTAQLSGVAVFGGTYKVL